LNIILIKFVQVDKGELEFINSEGHINFLLGKVYLEDGLRYNLEGNWL